MKLLAVDTSTKNLSLAVSDNKKVLRYRNVTLGNVLSSSIIPEIRSILKKAGVPLNKIDGFAVGLGPGSFTGLRVGLSTVKALAFASQKPIVGIPSLDVLAMSSKDEGINQVCVVSDARRDMVYSGLYLVQKGVVKRISPYALAPIENVLAPIEGKVLLVGDGIKLFKDAIIKASHKGKRYEPVFADEKEWFPQARNLVELSAERFAKKKTDNIDKLIPLYLYPDDCQVRR